MAQDTANVTPTPPDAYRHAIEAFQAGKLAEAEQLCQIIVTARDDVFEVLHLLAIVQSRLGRKSDALASFDRALAVQPDNHEVLNNRGVTLRELGRIEEALASYERAIAIRPDYAVAYNNRGNALKDQKRLDDAISSFERAIALRPDYFDALKNRGNALHETKRFEEALEAYGRLLALRPDDAGTLNNRGVTLRALQQFDEAVASYDRAIEAQPNYSEAYFNRGNAQLEMERLDDAIASYDHAIALRPDYTEAFNNRGNAQREAERLDDAMASYKQALAIRPDYVDALSNCGRTLMELSRNNEALAIFDQARALLPDSDAVHYNRGLAFHELMRFPEAIESYDRAISITPDYGNAHFAKSVSLLLLGDFDRGWREYEWRWSVDKTKFPDRERVFPQPLWLGDADISGRTVLLHAEQGFGDIIQFCQFASLVAQCGAQVVLQVEPELKSLMASLAGCSSVIAQDDALPPFDYHTPLMSLPLAFKTSLITIPNSVPYLSAPPEKVDVWRERLGGRTGARVGLVWAGNPRMGIRNARLLDRRRSMHFDQLARLFEQDKCQFVSLQKGGEAAEQLCNSPLRDRVLDITADLRDFSDTAAVIENLDLVIAVDTSVAHLAGALGKPVWLMNRYITCWRWLLDREDSPWYPTARLFRQNSTRMWDNVIERVHAALQDFVDHAPR